MSNQLRPLFHEPQAEDYLNAAKAVAEMLKNTAIETPEGVYWEEEPFSPVDFHETTFMGRFSLYSGTPGVIYFLTQLARVTKDDSYLKDAAQAAEYIINRWPDIKIQQYGGDIEHSEWGVLNGVSGIAHVMSELAEATDEKEYNEFAVKLIEEVAEAARETDEGIVWTGEPAVFFDSGNILFLINAAEKYERKDWYELAMTAGEKILQEGQEDDENMMTWPTISPTYFGIPEDSIMPNYFYGTAGVAYVMAVLYEQNKDERYLKAAKKGAKYIQSIATVEGDNILFPHSFPHLKDVHYLGLCHGASGTLRLFYKLYKVTGESEYKEWTEHIVNGILNTGAPELHSDGYWNVASQCCGSAGMSSVFIGLWAETQDKKYLSYARRAGKQLLSESIYDEEVGACWYHAFDRTNPENVTCKIGYLDGATGIAAELVQLYQAMTNQFDILRLPDDPYPKTL